MGAGSFTVTVDTGGVAKRIDAIVNNPRVKTFAAQAVAGVVEEKVPLDKGALRTSVRVLPLQVDYTMPYARRVFYGRPSWHWTTPGTGPRWDREVDVFKVAKHITDYIARI